MLPVNRVEAASDTYGMPIGPICRACGASLPPDLGWCSTCFTPVTLYAARESMRSGYVGAPTPTPRTSRWRAGPTSFGPVGRILTTAVLLAFFPWWGMDGLTPASVLYLWFLMGWVMLASIVLRQVWRRERVPEDAPPPWAERFREHHPVLGKPIRLGAGARVAVLVVAIGVAAGAWIGLDDVNRYVWAVVALATGLAVFLASWNDL
jgi:hypothetical protein